MEMQHPNDFLPDQTTLHNSQLVAGDNYSQDRNIWLGGSILSKIVSRPAFSGWLWPVADLAGHVSCIKSQPSGCLVITNDGRQPPKITSGPPGMHD